jgi:isopenicillin N synthase-like dioxygenase
MENLWYQSFHKNVAIPKQSKAYTLDAKPHHPHPPTPASFKNLTYTLLQLHQHIQFMADKVLRSIHLGVDRVTKIWE